MYKAFSRKKSNRIKPKVIIKSKQWFEKYWAKINFSDAPAPDTSQIETQLAQCLI